MIIVYSSGSVEGICHSSGPVEGQRSRDWAIVEIRYFIFI